MPRFVAPIAVVALVLVGLLVAGRGDPLALAQEGTPPAEEEFELPEGVAFIPLGYGTAEKLPAAPADLLLARFTLEPGAGFDLDANDPSVALVYVEAGTLTVQVDAPIRVTRAAALAAFATPEAMATPPAPEEVAAGTAFTLAAGDSAVFPPNVAGEVRNEGAEGVAGLVALVEPREGGEATPVA